MSVNLAVATALNRAPSGWTIHCFNRILSRKDARRGDSAAQLLSLSSQGYLYERNQETDRQQAAEENLQRCLLVDPGDLVVNPMWLSGGSIAVSDRSGAVSPDYRVFTPSPEVYPRFLHHLMRSDPYREQYQLLVRAETTFDRRVQQGDLDALPVLAPPLDDQRRIADFLDDQVTRIESVVTLRQAQLAALDEVTMHVLADAAHALWPTDAGRSVPWFPVRRSGWRLMRISWIATCLDGMRVPLSATQREGRQGPYPYYGASAVLDHVDDYLFDEELVLVGEDGGALTNPRFDVVQEVSGRIWVNNHAHVLRAVAVETEYLAAILRCVDRPLLLSGSTRPKITQDDLMSLRVPVPPIDDRVAVMRRATELRGGMADYRNALNRSIRLLDEYKRSLITAAVTGELDVTTASPGVPA